MNKIIVDILSKIEESGYEAYIVGGYVRDKVLGMDATDIDICTNAKVFEIKKACGEKILKVIIETCLLNDEEKKKMCELVSAAGAEYIKTSTGFSKYGARVEDVELMKTVVKDKMFIKASGGIGDLETMKAMIAAGASRIGTSKGAQIMEEIKEKSTKDGEL